MESLHTCTVAGVEAVIAIDSTVRGPALGGCRWRPYPDLESAHRDAVALAAAMTRKAAMARLALGGGKAVVVGDPRSRTTEQLLAFGAFVESLGGRYVTGADMGTGEAEMKVIARATRHAVGLALADGGCGDPSPYTAKGVLLAINAALAERDLQLSGSHVVVQGVGSVGGTLARILLEAGAAVSACDPVEAATAALPSEVRVVSAAAATSTPCEVFAPCGPPGVIDVDVARSLPAGIVCGAANNPLSDPCVAAELALRDILYVPDFVANAGGLIHLAVAREGGDATVTHARLAVITDNLRQVTSCAKEAEITTSEAAERLARQRVSS